MLPKIDLPMGGLPEFQWTIRRPDGSILAAADSNRIVADFDVDGEHVLEIQWSDTLQTDCYRVEVCEVEILLYPEPMGKAL